jgi:hypothetical protein
MATTGGRWYGGYTVETTTNGIQVEKGLDLETLALPAVRFRFESHRDSRVGVVLEDQVPDSVSVHDIGFHVDHGADNWHVYDGGRLHWVDTLDAGETTSTLYGIWLSDLDDVYDVFESPTIEVVKPLPHGDQFAPRLDGNAVQKHSVDEALESDRFEKFDALRTEIATALGYSGGQDHEDQEKADRPRPVADGPPIERAGEAKLDPPAPTAIHALDDPTVTGERLFVRTLVRKGTVPQVAESISRAGDVVGRRIRDHRSGHELFETVIATAHAPGELAERLANREVVGGVLIAIVEKAMPDAPDELRSMTEFSLLQHEVDTVSPGRLEAELEGGRDGGMAVSDLVSQKNADKAQPSIDDPSPTTGDTDDGETVEVLRAEVERLRHRVSALEAEVDRLQEEAADEPDESQPEKTEPSFDFMTN